MKGLYVLIADGAPPPGKDGRARIIKMLIRRVVTRQIILGIKSNDFLPAIVDCIAKMAPGDMQTGWIQEQVISYFLLESQRFLKTIERGQHKLVKFLQENDGHALSKAQVSCLETQWGLPSLLTELALQQQRLPSMQMEHQDAFLLNS
jgi:alanyl-tRNA synthetase